MSAFDYNAPAELFPSKRTGSRFAKVSYKRFDAAAAAIQYAMEELEPDRLAGAVLEVAEERYDDAAIKSLYVSDLYPLDKPRKG
ncbi:hypothetical protein [Hyphomicrobium sp.]|uniref:hypothetical protein n=1 Tax=Hyphomicrobium sp. TaxID=82 RepID=UPI002E31C500|nr:hypothetical protein [Hyphomicrobium sp.]HEX2842682.1 hypothetical protein [Hyphomicrobium sp.]